MRKKAMEFGYLPPDSCINVVSNGPYIELLPASPGVLYVPYYDPTVVFARPARSLEIGGAGSVRGS